MTLVLTKIGREISTEKLVIQAVTDTPGNVNAVLMEVLINSAVVQSTLEHLPVIGTVDTYDFEINSIVKDYFASDFLALTGANQTSTENALVAVRLHEVLNGVIDPVTYRSELVIKNITQDVFEIEDFDLTDYDCGDTGSTASKLLTSAPSPLLVGDNTSFHVSCLTTSYNVLVAKQEWTIETYLNGVFVAQLTDSVDVPTRGILGEIVGGKYDVSNYRFDFVSSTGYDEVRIYIRDIAGPNTQRSETKVFKLNDACEKELTLSWHNELGQQDSYSFLGNINRTGKYTDSTFKRVRPVNPLSTNVGDLVYKSDYNYQYDLYSGRIPEKDVQWLSKMLINKRAAIQTKSIAASGPLNFNTVQYFGSMPIAAAYQNLVDGGNGFAYGAPRRAGNFIKYEIATDTITTIASTVPSGLNSQYTLGILSPTNGKIYFMNSHPDTTDILVFDPSSETYYTFGVLTGTAGVPSITSSGIIYANTATGSSKFFKIDTNTDTATEFTSGVTSGGGSSVYSPTGFVYIFPSGSAGEYYKINVSTDAVLTIADANYNEINSFQSVITTGGIIYVPITNNAPIANEVFKVDTATDISANINTGSLIAFGYQYAFLMGDNVYLLGAETNILKLDTSNDLITTAGAYVPANYDYMTVIGNNAYAIDQDLSGEVLKISFNSANSTQPGKYFPIVIETEESTLEDKFTPETLFRVKFRMANRRKGLK